MSAKTAFQYLVPRRSMECCHGQETFEPGMRYYSTVVPDEENDYRRLDYCEACWQAHGQEACHDSSQGFWVNKVPIKIEPKPPIDRVERALELLKEYTSIEEMDEETATLAFFIAVFLAHRRRLSLRKEITKNQTLFSVYENPQTEDTFVLKQVDLSKVDLESVQVKIAAKMRDEESDAKDSVPELPKSDRRNEQI
ncbi:MAG: hypothetical protein CMO81_10935 [Waddliaceae bacterium]|nr:hypothetical protein [Waddliaceae bacterium]